MQLTTSERTMLFMRLPQTGVAAYWRSLERFASLQAAMAAPSADLKGCLKPEAIEALQAFKKQGEEHPLYAQLQADLAWLSQHPVSLVDTESELYPSLLREVHRAPPLLYVWGDATLLSLPQVAVVGSRNPTAGGRANAIQFAQGLAQTGFTITSGLALGVDAAAHQGALQIEGKTLAILGTGVDQIYPARHQHLAEQIVTTGGAVVSEFPLGTRAHPSNFPQRNRIISGLSCGVLVVEAAIKSGSLITARYALGQNREVFAIPGSIQNPLSKGCHALIREGAKLVESSDDIVEELQSMLAFQRSEIEPVQLDVTPEPAVTSARLAARQPKTRGKVEQKVQQAELPLESEPIQALDGNEGHILECLAYDPVPFDSIAERTGLAAGDLMAALLTLELKGVLENVGHGYARVRS